MKKIKLTRGKFAIVDDDMYDKLNKFKWCTNKYRNNFYAVRNGCMINGKRRSILMHRVILGIIDSEIHCDHINHDGLDNQKCNLRTCTITENNRNTRGKINGTSKYKGVYLHKKTNKWMARIYINKKLKYLGSFIYEIEAAHTYDEFAKLHYGDFAYLNFKK